MAFDTETHALGTGEYGLVDGALLQFHCRVTLAADQELSLMNLPWVVAADKRVKRCDAMHQSVLKQEVQCAVYRWWSGPPTIGFTQHGQYVVGTQWLMAAPDQFKHPFAQTGKPQAAGFAECFRAGQGMVDAAAVVMRAARQRRVGGEWFEHRSGDFLQKRRYYISLSEGCDHVLRLSFSLLLLCCCALANAEVRLLTSIKPLQLIAAAVQEGVATPDVLLPPGMSPHNFALRPSDVSRVQEAQLFYWVGPDLETFLPRVLQGRVQPSVAVETLPGLQLRYFGESPGNHADAANPAITEQAGDHDHHPGTLDTHLWLSTGNAKVIAAKMAADLALLDPGNAQRYQANLAAFKQRLDMLDAQLLGRLASIHGKPYFVFHEAYDYFEAAYGLQHAGVFSLGSEVQPGARRVAQMREQLVAAGSACVFNEPPVRPRLAETLSAGLPIRLAQLDALGSEISVSPQGYEQLLQSLANGMLACMTGID